MKKPPDSLILKPTQLRLIHAIAEHKQLQIAASNCAMTQPAASRMLAAVEHQMGAPLFLRQPKGMEPTELGEIVLRRARVILREIYSLAQDVSAQRKGFAGSVHVGAVTGPAVGYLVAAIREIKSHAPEADIRVDVLPSHDLLMQLAAGNMDFVLARILPEFDSRDFNITPLRGENVSFLARASHPLARAQTVTLTELTEYEWIMQQRGAPIREAALAAFADVGAPEPANIVSSPSLLLTIAYLAQCDAVSAMSEEVANLLVKPPISAGFAILRVPHRVRVAPYYMLNLKRRPLSLLAFNLRESVIRHAMASA